MRTSSYLFICAALSIASCTSETEGSSRIEGRVTDAGGAQTQSFGGEGTTLAATSVRASAVSSDGSLELLAEADLSADASYSLELPAHERGVILQAVDASGEVLAAAILEDTGAAGESVLVTPMDSESSLEAAVFVEMIAQGVAVSEANVIDLRARITSELSLAVRIAHDRGDDVSEAVSALALAVRAAQETEIAMYARAGVSVTQADLFALELAASSELSASLHAGESADAAYDAFFETLASATAELGVDAEQRGRAEAAAGASFRATVEARLTTESSAMVRESALLAAASVEARAHEEATLAILSAGEAGADVQASATSAATTLRAELATATTAAAAADAYARFATAIRGEAQLTGSLLGTYLELDVLGSASAEAAVDASAAAAAELSTAIDAAAQASVQAAGAVDTRALAADVAAAYGAYFEVVAAQQAVLAAASDELRAETAVDLLIVADGSFAF